MKLAPTDAAYRVVLIGDASVGKTSIISRLIDNTFNAHISSTVGANFQQFSQPVGDRIITLQVWDTAGQERFRALSPIYYRGAHAGVAVFSMDNHDSLESLPEQISVFLEVAKNARVFIVGNKIDLNDQNQFSKSEAEGMAAEQEWPIFFTSAQTGVGVVELFSAICKELSTVVIEGRPRFEPPPPERECC
jgi:small GTP-binding protein